MSCLMSNKCLNFGSERKFYDLYVTKLRIILHAVSHKFHHKDTIQHVQDELMLVIIIDYRQLRILLPIPLSGF
jgi:hypothetical protein